MAITLSASVNNHSVSAKDYVYLYAAHAVVDGLIKAINKHKYGIEQLPEQNRIMLAAKYLRDDLEIARRVYEATVRLNTANPDCIALRKTVKKSTTMLLATIMNNATLSTDGSNSALRGYMVPRLGTLTRQLGENHMLIAELLKKYDLSLIHI